MKQLLSSVIIILLFTQCDGNFGLKREKDVKERGTGSVMGTVSLDSLPNFHLKRDTVYAETDTLGYYIVTHLSNNVKSKPVVVNAEISDCIYPNDQCLKTMIQFCKGQITDTGFKIVLHGSSISLFNEVLTLGFVDSFVIARNILPEYKDGQITYNCDYRTDSLRVKLSKYPVKKGDLVRGHLYYKAWKVCVLDLPKEVVGEKLIYKGYFECIVE